MRDNNWFDETHRADTVLQLSFTNSSTLLELLPTDETKSDEPTNRTLTCKSAYRPLHFFLHCLYTAALSLRLFPARVRVARVVSEHRTRVNSYDVPRSHRQLSHQQNSWRGVVWQGQVGYPSGNRTFLAAAVSLAFH